eukprot:CAMPEP_0119552876 /NCGR_PEP_ID=MMETSP1352-20130426/5768_1 /TAXON_ID=265584 /ORGANISM="Stauroneis constricta, Strain CCMP1120" /LENGTH=789 /DNA_ID=CAMNT_0007599185 /DNA_START=460 /DNA_END=2829 /DNA_ORIENTATION=+
MKILFRLPLLLMLASTADASSGVQKGPRPAPYYAGGMSYDPHSNLVYVTGTTYMQADDKTISPTSNCYVGILRAPSSQTDNKFQWIQEQEIGTAASQEACFGITLSSDQQQAQNSASSDSQSAYIIGTSEESGLLTDLRVRGSSKATQYGTVLNLGFASSGQGRLYGGYLMHDFPVNHPIAIVTDKTMRPGTSNYVYVVSMTSDNKQLSAHYTRDVSQENEYPNLTRGGPTPKFGADFELLVERMAVESTPTENGDTNEIETLLPTWRKPLATSGSSVLVSGMIQTSLGQQPLILAGSAKGSTGLIGDAAAHLSPSRWSGFLLMLDPTNGSKIGSKRFAAKDDEHFEILGICSNQNRDDGFIYLVGATSGVMDKSGKDHPPTDNQVDAVIAKVKISTLEMEWVQQLRATDTEIGNIKDETDLIQTYAADCVVSKDGNTVYAAGNVEDEMVMVDAQQSESNGWDDIWVASFQTVSGNTNWMQQVGSIGDDRVARGGALSLDATDNLIVFGDTTGSLYRFRDEATEVTIKFDDDPDNDDYPNDLFLLTMDPQGNFKPASYLSGVEGDNEHSASTQPPIVLATEPPVAASSTDDSGDSDDVPTARYRFMTVAFALAVIAAVVACLVARKNQQEKEIVTERSQVFAYLQSFDVEDVDLRHSATGGWHGTYVNNLAHGVNKADPNDVGRSGGSTGTGGYEDAPLTHSSVVRDSLFMDVDSRPSLGGSRSESSDDDVDDDIDINIGYRDHHSDDDSSAGYDGLVGAYNDLQPRSYQDRKKSLNGKDNKPWGKEII